MWSRPVLRVDSRRMSEPVEIRVRDDGPYKVTGPVRLVDPEGNEIPYDARAAARAVPLRALADEAVLRQGAPRDAASPRACGRRPPRVRTRRADLVRWLAWPAPPPSTSAPPAGTRPQVARPLPGLRRVEHAGRGGRRAARGERRAGRPGGGQAVTPVALGEVEAADVARLSTGIGELDRVLGGGLVPGSLVLIGGSPGIGKSHAHERGARRTSPAAGPQDALRLRRGVGGPGQAARRAARARHALAVPIVAETDLDAVLATLEARAARRLRGRLGADAARRRRSPARPARSGRCARSPARLMRVAKERGIAMLLVGHVTKEGALAGPARARAPGRLRAPVRGRARAHLPHAARAQEPLRLHERGRACSRCATDGLVEVEDASARFVGEADPRARLGRAVRDGGLAPAARRGAGAGGAERAGAAAAGRQRRRPQPARARARRAGPPRRRRRSARRDVFVSVAGGVRVDEPGADLAIALARRVAPRAGVALGRRAAPPLAASASSASPASCATSPTPTAGSRRRASSGSSASCTPDGAARCGGAAPAARTRRRAAACAAAPERSRSATAARVVAAAQKPCSRAENRSEIPVEWARYGAAYRGRAQRELEARQEPRLVRALEMVAPGHGAAGGHRQHRPRPHRRA